MISKTFGLSTWKPLLALMVVVFCGHQTLVEATWRIRNGQPVRNAADYPFITMLYGEGLCTGSLVTPDKVITAAHCVCEPGSVKKAYFAYLNPQERGKKTIPIAMATMNPKWQAECEAMRRGSEEDVVNGNDIAILSLAQKATQFSGVHAVRLGKSFLPRMGTQVRLVGYGVDKTQHDMGILREGYGKLTHCVKRLKNAPICVGDADGYVHQNTDAGDSGGPLLTMGKEQVGVCSGLEDFETMGIKGKVMIFSSVPKNLKFIHAHI